MIKKTILEISKNFQDLAIKSTNDIIEAKELMINALDNDCKIIFCGNGGSAADSQHLAAELIGRYRINRNPIRAVSLTTDTSTITAIANDFSFEDIFSRQVQSLGNQGDILYAISTSGNSKNILKAIEQSKKQKIKIIGVTGENSCLMDDMCDVLIKAPATTPDRIQEMHIAIGQIICDQIEKKFFSKQ